MDSKVRTKRDILLLLSRHHPMIHTDEVDEAVYGFSSEFIAQVERLMLDTSLLKDPVICRWITRDFDSQKI